MISSVPITFVHRWEQSTRQKVLIRRARSVYSRSLARFTSSVAKLTEKRAVWPSMVFSEPIFLFLFLPIALAATSLALFVGRGHSATLFLLSLGFYFRSSGALTLLLLGCVVANWAMAIAIHRSPRESNSRSLLPLGVFINLVPLAYYKYAHFLSEQVDASIGTTLAPRFAEVALPVGISFFAFQGMSYLIDVSRGDAEPEESFLRFGAYLTFFPQLIAGPIVRYRDAIESYRNPGRSPQRVAYGVRRFAHGLLKKVVVADTVARVADVCFAMDSSSLTPGVAWLGAIAYSIQIYFDFSGYSDMAIGLAAICGIHLRENFERPYASGTLTEFWRRWHISLSSWFRDYLYIPLGGNRGPAHRTYANLLIVFLATGLWHGAAWNFVAWGLFHGLFLVVERAIFPANLLRQAGLAWRFSYALPITIFGWVLFRAESLGAAAQYWKAMLPTLTPSWNLAAPVHQVLTPATIAVLACSALVFVLPRDRRPADLLSKELPASGECLRTAYLALALVVSGILALTSDFSPFLYFRF